MLLKTRVSMGCSLAGMHLAALSRTPPPPPRATATVATDITTFVVILLPFNKWLSHWN